PTRRDRGTHDGDAPERARASGRPLRHSHDVHRLRPGDRRDHRAALTVAATALAAGLGLGFFVGAQVGPIWLLCARSTLRLGFRVGAAIGAGAAVVDLLYAAFGVAGASRLLDVDPLRITLGVL